MNRIASVATLLGFASSFVALAGCGEKPFLKINGQTVSREEYVRALERINIPLPGNQTVNAERLVIDQLVGNKIILAEAARLSVAPTDDAVKKLYDVQRKIFEQQSPGKSYEDELKKNGTTPEEIREDLKVQMAEVAVYSNQMKLGEDEVRKAYEQLGTKLGLPARTQIRLVVVAPNSPQFTQAQKMIADKKPFEEVARQVNLLPSLRASGGLQVVAEQAPSYPKALLDQIKQTAEGASFGPVDFQQPGAPGRPAQTLKAWAKVEKKLPAFRLSFEDASPLIRQSLVRQRVLLPDNAKIRDGIMKQKMDASFEATDAMQAAVWEAVKQQARDAGVGQLAASSVTVPTTATVPGDAAAPGAGAAPKKP